MEQEISLLDLLAAAVRKGKQIIIFAIIIGLLVMGHSLAGVLKDKGNTSDSGKVTEDESYTLAEKEQELRDQEKVIERSQRNIDSEREYIRDSLFIQLDPYKIYNTRINYLVTDVVVPLDGSLGMMENPTSYAIESIIARYLLEWGGTNLKDNLNVPGYQNIDDRYLREVISVRNGGYGNIAIVANSTSEVESQKLAKAAEALVLSLANGVADETYAHNIVKVSSITKTIIDNDIRTEQNYHYDIIDKQIDGITEAKQSIAKLESEQSGKTHIKKFIIGCFAGGVLSALWVMFRSMVRGIAESTEQVASRTGLQYMGNAVSGKEKCIFAKLASIITGEKIWRSNEEALAYMAERVSMKEKERLLVTTTGTEADPEKIEALLSALNSSGVQAKYLPSFSSSAEALASLKDSDGVLFAVTKSKTSVPDLVAAKNLVEQAGKSATGYVML